MEMKQLSDNGTVEIAMINLSEPEVYTVKSGKFAGKKLTQLPAWMLRWMKSNHSDPRVRQGAIEVLDMRSRLGIPEKPKKGGKSLEKQAEIPLQDDRIAKKHPVSVDFLTKDASKPENDLF